MTANTPAAQTTRYCNCGCDQAVGAKSNYKPGHDAAHVSRLVAAVATTGDFSQANVDRFSASLPSDALKGKFGKAIDRLAAKNATKPGKSLKNDKRVTTFNPMLGHVAKIGRWTYPVAEGSDGVVYRNEKTNGKGAWVYVDSKNVIDA